MIIRSDRIYTSDGCINGVLEIENGMIKEIRKGSSEEVDHDFTGNIIYPGLIDTHNHGNYGYALRNTNQSMEERMELVECYLKNLASFGITGVFPTCSYDNVSCVESVTHKKIRGSKILGIHVEGPWLARAGEKGTAAAYPQPTKEMAEQMVRDGKGMLKLVALSPEVKNIENITDVMHENHVALSMAHTSFNFQQATDAINNFHFVTATHVGNGMSGMHHRDVGALGAALLNQDIYCEIICDFIHLCKEMVEIIFKVKSHDKLMLISDNSEFTRLPKGRYKLDGGYIDSDGVNTLITNTGKIQGSNRTILNGLQNIVKEIGISLEEAWKMTSYNVCTHYGIEKHGKLEQGYYADFVVMNQNLEIEKTFLEGIEIYDSKKDQPKINELFVEENMIK